MLSSAIECISCRVRCPELLRGCAHLTSPTVRKPVALRHCASHWRKPLAIFLVVRQAHSTGSEDAELQAHYAQGREWDRLDDPKGVVEFERTRRFCSDDFLPRRRSSPTLEVGRGAMRCGWLSWVTS